MVFSVCVGCCSLREAVVSACFAEKSPSLPPLYVQARTEAKELRILLQKRFVQGLSRSASDSHRFSFFFFFFTKNKWSRSLWSCENSKLTSHFPESEPESAVKAWHHLYLGRTTLDQSQTFLSHKLLLVGLGLSSPKWYFNTQKEKNLSFF